MKTVKEITEKCIYDLKYCPANSPGGNYSFLAERSSHIAYELREALNRNDFDCCILIVEDQLHQLCGNTKDTNVYSADIQSIPHARSDFMKDPCYRAYCAAIIRAFRDFKLLKVSVEQPGIAAIHRIWLGKMPAEEKLVSLRASNMAIMDHWYVAPEKKQTDFSQVLWTDNKSLLHYKSTNPSALSGIDVVDINSIFLSKSIFYKLVYSLIKHQEYALASDLLRFLILKYYGGLFVGFGWRSSYEKTPAKTFFCPRLYTLKALFIEERFINEEIHLGNPYEGLVNGYFSLLEETFKPNKTFQMFGMVDSDIFYAGAPNHPFVNHVLNIIEEVMEAGLNYKGAGYFKEYRTQKYKSIKDKWVSKKASASECFPPKFDVSEQFINDLHKNPRNNVTILTHVFALCQAFVDMGYMMKIPDSFEYTDYSDEYIKKNYNPEKRSDTIIDATDERLFQRRSMAYWLSYDCRFLAQPEKVEVYCPVLGLCRGDGGSWYNVSLKDKLSIED